MEHNAALDISEFTHSIVRSGSFFKAIGHYKDHRSLFSGLMDSPMTVPNSCRGLVAHQTSHCGCTNPRASRLSRLEQLISKSQGMRHSLEAWTGLGKEGGEPTRHGGARTRLGWGNRQLPSRTWSQARGPGTPRSLPGVTGRGGTESPQGKLDPLQCPGPEARAAGAACGSPGPGGQQELAGRGRKPSGAGLVTSPWPAPRS